ncbi:protein strawberry notch isoform X1 [Zeugodacus cucurbitae]|uniref:protein strawberry notch isoform X1 n=1 Tax=Zeugodacus cucurbitae TaxID=28588 RepID=UPI0010A74394|nr:protein strawberry notch isoform X1 [Zeugodacus cucurbitae]
MASLKKSIDFNDDVDLDDDDDSCSDFDDDEDPDKIEVPGGGRDLQTAVTYAKNSGHKANSANSNNNKNISNNNNSLLTSNQPRINNSLIATKPTTGGISLLNNNNMPKKSAAAPAAIGMSNYPSSSGSAAAAAAVAAAASAGYNGLPSPLPFSANQLMNMAAYAMASGAGAGGNSGGGGGIGGAVAGNVSGGAAGLSALLAAGLGAAAGLNALPNINALNTNAAALAAVTGAGAGVLGSPGNYYQTNSNLNMAASLLAQMSMGLGYNSAPTTAASMPANANPPASAASSQAKTNALIMQKIQALVAANPSFLTSGIPNHVLAQLFMQPMKTAPATVTAAPPEEEEVDYEEMGVAETYAEYWPAKLKLGKKHPDPVVETASLSSVEPCDVYYKLSIPTDTINSGYLSALQLESITYASQAHDHMLPDGTRAGFLIGDGAGVGKGRTIAGIIYENYLKGRKKALWISVSNDLKYDAERDLLDIGASKIEVHALNKFKYAKISSDVNNNCKRGVIFSTYSALIGESNNKTGKYKSRLKQLLQWCGEDFDGLIIFDECHKAKNLCPVGSGKPTKTGQTVLELQNKLPKARVVYASATGASEPKNMAYMVRLGLWGQGTAFPSFNDFIMAVEKRGVGAMEIVAMDMKLRGMYIARQLSFHGVTFKIEEVALSKDFRKVYDQSVELWVEAMQKFTEAAELIDAESRMKKTMWGQFWSSHQRFFKYLCIAAKVNHAVQVAREAIKYGKCVVIGLQSTGEARTLEQLERDDGELTDFVSTAKGVFQSLVEKHFPAPDRNRINRILGLGGYGDAKKNSIQSIIEEVTSKRETASIKEEPCSSSSSNAGSKRKMARDDARTKKTRKNSWNDSDDDSQNESEDSDYKMSNSESEESDVGAHSDSCESSDFNPFFSGSDSDNDPWVARSKKKAKKKAKQKESTASSNNNNSTNTTVTTTATTASATNTNGLAAAANAVAPKRKGPVSTQDRIQDLLQKKQELKGTVTQVGVNGIKLNYGPPPKDAIERACSMKEELLRKIERLGDRLPPNTLDQLIDELGGPDNVAEMTGRKGRVVQSEDGSIQYESRSEQDVPLETLNITEKQRFMDGEKDVAIISEAASSGISLQSDRRVRNQRRRVHITLELPWSADRAIQQFGRTHRSNQVNAPEYIFLISDLAGERRFASTVAKRLESLGALTHGDRRATETRDLSQFNIDNKYGRTALETVMKTIMGYESPLVPPPTDYKGDFFKDIAGALVGVGIIVNSESNPGVLSLDKEYNNISKFLNRILGMPVELQNRLFKYFTDTLTAIIHQAKRGGRFDLGILDLGAAGENVTRVKLVRFIRKHATGKAPAELHTVRVERGMIWQEAIDKYADLISEFEGFYVSHQVRNGKRTAILAVEIETPQTQQQSQNKKKEKGVSKKDIMYQVYRPNTGLQIRHESLAELEKKYKKVPSEEAEPHWIQQYDASVNTCSHAYWNGNCRNVNLGNECEVGLRQRLYYVLAGSVLSVWTRVEQVLATRNANNKMQVIRMKTTEGEKIVGTLIPKSCHELLLQDLKSDAERIEEVKF